MKRLVVEWPATLVEYCHSYNDCGHVNSNHANLELQLCLHSVVQTRHTAQSIQVTRRNGLYIWLSERLTRWFDHGIWILEASWLPLFQLHQNLTFKDMEINCREGTTNPYSGDFEENCWVYFVTFQCIVQHCTAYTLCGQLDATTLSCHVCM